MLPPVVRTPNGLDHPNEARRQHQEASTAHILCGADGRNLAVARQTPVHRPCWSRRPPVYGTYRHQKIAALDNMERLVHMLRRTILMGGVVLVSATLTGPSKFLRVFPLQLAGAAVFPLNCFVHFLPMNGDLRGGLDTQPDLVTANIDDGDNDVVAYDDAFVTLSGEDQHGGIVGAGGDRVGNSRWWRDSCGFSEWLHAAGYFVLERVGISDNDLAPQTFFQVHHEGCLQIQRQRPLTASHDDKNVGIRDPFEFEGV